MKKLMMVVLVALASGFSPAQLSNYGTTQRIIRSWGWNTCLYTGTVTVSVTANSPEDALVEAAQEYPETDINFNHMLNVLDMEPTAVECPDGKVVEV